MLDTKRRKEEKRFYNLIADSFLTLYSYCNLFFNHAWSQAFALLRVGLEQVAAVYILCNVDGAHDEYIKLYDLYLQYIELESEEEKKSFKKENNIKDNINNYFDYSWISKFTMDHKYGRKQLLELARLDEFIRDIEESLNAFSHGSISVFQMSKDNWAVMKTYGRRACLTCCKLYDFLCCSYFKLIGVEEFTSLALNNAFIEFKYHYKNWLANKTH